VIISHKHRFIFLKTEKTAGTSVEIALSEFCGPDDVITPIIAEDEAMRAEAGFRGPQNYDFGRGARTLKDAIRVIKGKPIGFRAHSPAAYVARYAPSAAWRDYLKFTIVRNPFDCAISRHFWANRAAAADPSAINAAILAERPERLSNWPIYTIGGEIVADQVVRYEHLVADLEALRLKLGLPSPLRSFQAKGGVRKNRAHYSAVLDAAARARIETVCAPELAAHGYRWEAPKSERP